MDIFKIAKGIFAAKVLKRPFYMHLFVTRRCNFKCKMCNVWKIKNEREMPIDEIRTIAKKLRKLGLTIVVLTGGEPILRKDIVEIVKSFSELGIKVRLQTNGMLLTEKKLDDLVKAGVDEISVSIDTLDNKKQSEICGVSADVVGNAVKVLKMIVRKMPKSMPTANVVVSHKNLHEIPDMIRYFDSIGVWLNFSIVSLSFDRDDSLFRAKSDDFAFTKSDKEKTERVFREIIALKKMGYRTLSSMRFLKQTIECIKSGNERWDCEGGIMYFSIFPDGRFAMCDEITTKHNILDKNFIETFQSKAFRNSMRNVQRNCKGCFFSCWRETSNLINSPDVIFDRFLTLVRVKKRKLFHKTEHK